MDDVVFGVGALAYDEVSTDMAVFLFCVGVMLFLVLK